MSSRTAIASSFGGYLPRVPRLCREPRVFDRDSDREVIQALEGVIAKAEDVVHGIVVETADAGAACASGFGFEIEHLSHDPRFPEQAAVERVAERSQRRVEVGNHAEAEEPVSRDVLVAAQTPRQR